MCRGGEQQRPARSPTHNTKHRIRTPAYPSLSLHSPLSPPRPPSISFSYFFSDSHECLSPGFHWKWSVHADPVSVVSITHPGSHWHSAPLLSQIAILQYIICLGCWPFVLPPRLLPSQIDSTVYVHRSMGMAVTEILQCTRRLPLLVTRYLLSRAISLIIHTSTPESSQR